MDDDDIMLWESAAKFDAEADIEAPPDAFWWDDQGRATTEGFWLHDCPPPSREHPHWATADPSGGSAFWDARPELSHIRDFARARRVGPWALFGAVLTELGALVPPTVRLPALVGSQASLNQFIALVGASGSGKDQSRNVAHDAFRIDTPTAALEPPWAETFSIGTGQGLAHAFMEGGQDGPVQVRTRAVLSAGEIDSIAAHSAMQGQTLMAELRKIWSGEQFGHQYANAAKRVPVAKHTYRANIIAGVQPKRSAVLFNDAGGGTPQRIVWLPASDPEAPDNAPEQPEPMPWSPPQMMNIVELGVCAEARRDIDQGSVRRLRGEQSNELDAHRMLVRMKVAAMLALLARRMDVTAEDWALSDVVMSVSDGARQLCLNALTDEGKARTVARAKADAERAEYVGDRAEERLVQRAVKSVLGRLNTEWATRSAVRRSLKSDVREVFDDAVALLEQGGQVEVKRDGDRAWYRKTG